MILDIHSMLAYMSVRGAFFSVRESVTVTATNMS